MVGGTSAVVEHSPQHPKVKGSSPDGTAGTGTKKIDLNNGRESTVNRTLDGSIYPV
jgi:hypothetical protein